MAEQGSGASGAKTGAILLLTFVNALGGTLLIPVLPFVVRDLGQSDFVFALLIAAYPFAQFFAAPVLGSMADYYGRRPVLLVSQAGTLASWLLFIAAWFAGEGLALALIAASRIIDGLTGGNASVAAAYLADVTTDEERTKIFGQQGAIAGVALIIGPAVGSFTAATSIGFLGPALLAAIISVITLVWMQRALVESLPADERSTELDVNPFHQLNLIGRVRKLGGRDALVRLFGVQVLVTLAFSSYTTIIILWYVDQLGVPEASAGLLMLATGVFLIFNETITVPAVERVLGDLGALLAGLTVMTVGFLLVRIPESVWWFLPAAFVLNVGFALVLPTMQSLVTKASDPAEKGEVQGVNTSVSALASTAAPVIAGAIYAGSGGGLTLMLVAVVTGLAAVFLAASARAVGARVGEELPSPHVHGPIHALSKCRGNGHRDFTLQLHGPRHEDSAVEA